MLSALFLFRCAALAERLTCLYWLQREKQGQVAQNVQRILWLCRASATPSGGRAAHTAHAAALVRFGGWRLFDSHWLQRKIRGEVAGHSPTQGGPQTNGDVGGAAGAALATAIGATRKSLLPICCQRLRRLNAGKSTVVHTRLMAVRGLSPRWPAWRQPCRWILQTLQLFAQTSAALLPEW